MAKVQKKKDVKEKNKMARLVGMSVDDLKAEILATEAKIFQLRDDAAAQLRAQRLPDSNTSTQKKVSVSLIPSSKRDIARMKMVLAAKQLQ